MTTMASSDVIRRLRNDGWRLVRTKGSHHQFAHPVKAGRVTLPHPVKDIPIGTLKSIFVQAAWPWPPR